MPAYSGCDIAASNTSRLALSTASSSAVLISASVGVAPSGLQPLAELALDALRGHAARHFARVVAAHAVGQHRDAPGFVERHGVFVIAACAAGISNAEELKDHEDGRMRRNWVRAC
jgi:hypothetical protein